MVMQGSAILSGMSPVLVVLAIETLIAFGWVSSHFVGPFEIRLILYLYKDLIYRLLKYQADYLGISSQRLVNEVSPRSIMVVPIKLRISPFRWEDLGLTLSLHLILFDLLMLINTIHELAQTPSELHS